MNDRMESQREQYRLRREKIVLELCEQSEDGSPAWTYAQIAERWGITRERVRQIARMYGVCRRTTPPITTTAKGGQQ